MTLHGADIRPFGEGVGTAAKGRVSMIDTSDEITPTPELQRDLARGTLVELHGMPVDEFIREHGAHCYAAVLADCGNDVTVAQACIETEFSFATTSPADFMEYLLFDIHVGAFDESNHPYLRDFIDYAGLAEARWKAGLIRIVPFDGAYYCFARCSGWSS
jgi:hypothetical protein